MTRLLDDEVLQSSDSREHSVFVELAGYVDVRMLREGQKSVLTLERGQCIPGTKTRMIAKSFCIDFKHLSHDWDALINDVGSSEPFSTDSYVPPGLSKEGKQFSEPLVSKPERDFYESEGAKYSLLLSGVEASQLSIDSLEGRIKSGIKVYLFVQTANRVAYEKLSRKYERNHFVLFSSDKKVPALRIEDGKIGEFHTEFNELSKLCPAFNVEQFLAEHADNDQVIVVKASAGTGKESVRNFVSMG